MIYLKLKNNDQIKSFDLIPKSAITINHQTHIVETIFGNYPPSPMDPDGSLSMVNDFLIQNFPDDIRISSTVEGIGISYVIPIPKPINNILFELSEIADEDLVEVVGFEYQYGSIHFGTVNKMFPEYLKVKNRVPLSRFIEFSINIFKPHEMFEMTIYPNFLLSTNFWVEFHQRIINQLPLINKINNPLLAQLITITQNFIIQHTTCA